jgi:hypothetical protein
MGNQHVPLTIDENDNVIAVGSINDDTFDVCVMCGKQSPYKRSTHIDHRIGYVEGAGQGCFEPHMCSQERSRQLFTISEELVYSTPNDQELGAKVRQIYWNNKNS